MSTKAKLYIGAVIAVGFVLLLSGVAHWQSRDALRFLCFLAVAIGAAQLKVSLPSVTGTMSVNFLFILFGIAEMTLAETLAVACLVTAVQCVWNGRRQTRVVQTLFNIAAVALAVTVAFHFYHLSVAFYPDLNSSLLLVIAAMVFFTANTFPVAAVIALTEKRPLGQVWHDCYFWSFPYYLAGGGVAGLMSLAQRYVGWQTSLVIVPVVYIIYRSYHMYLSRLDAEKNHAEDAASLHLRTIEALALAIEGTDTATHDHLQRVQVYALEVGKEMGLARGELDALRAAALLHDIGKLAVPEHIVCKPGRLTPEEFEKMKIHPAIGADILERVQFPYPVAPIVRAHHEKWDGSGYPQGLRGEQIPIGARILAAVDCLNAIASDRQYRGALPLEEAMQAVADEAGRSFDPRVIEALQRRYHECERLAMCAEAGSLLLPEAEPCEAVSAAHPAAPACAEPAGDFLHSIAAARQEVQTLFELTQDLGNSLSLDETLSVLALRLRRMIPWDAMAIYVKRDDVLTPEYVTGDDFRLFSSLEMPVGQGLSGWVAEQKRPLINASPSIEAAYLNDPQKRSRLGSALAVPLEGLSGVLGVLTLYRTELDAFSKDHLRVLLAISAKVGLSIDNALRFRQAENSATTDYLTGLPNARSLFLHLDAELARSRRAAAPVSVLVCDLDGFKQVNDRFGHLEGNKVLRDVAMGLKQVCREYDYVARMGGDEFVIILPGIGAEALAARLNEFRSVVREAGNHICGEAILSLSIGHASFPEHGTDAEGLLAEADRRMYKEKHGAKHSLAASRRLWEMEFPSSTVH